MRKSKFLAKLQQQQFIHACILKHYLPFYVRYASHFDFDGIWIDLEHQTMPERELQSLLGLCHYNDVDSIIRPATREPGKLNRYLEDGATGFMFPMVSDAETARQLVSAVKFPPEGNRGFAGAGLDADYILEIRKPDHTFHQDANRETFICVQIETPEAVTNAAEIAAVPGVDLLLIGPADLGLRMQDGMTLETAVETVIQATKTHQKAWGIATHADKFPHYRELGAQLLPSGSEYALMKVLEDTKQIFDQL
jgi:4-hydroxy-2-oxoheptanedioate aldolase